MSFLGNLVWLLLGGLISGLSWIAVGVLWCITIVGIPVGVQCFKFAKLSFCPFGKEVEPGGGLGSIVLNLAWLLCGGLVLAFESFVLGIVLCVTVVGIPFGIQHFKIGKLALMPFGAEID